MFVMQTDAKNAHGCLLPLVIAFARVCMLRFKLYTCNIATCKLQRCQTCPYHASKWHLRRCMTRSQALGCMLSSLTELTHKQSMTCLNIRMFCQCCISHYLMLLLHQGPYSHALAEWAITACSWFAKDLPRLKAQQKDHNWEPYLVEELRYAQQTYALACLYPRHCMQH